MMKYCIDIRQNTEETKALYKELIKEDAECPVSVQFHSFDRQLSTKGLIILADSTVTFKDGHSEKGTLRFIKDKGDWKLYITGDK